MPKRKPSEDKQYITLEAFTEAVAKLGASIEMSLSSQQQIQNQHGGLLREIEKLISIINVLKKENELLKIETKDARHAIEAILSKFNLEIKKTLKEKEPQKVIGLHDDYTQRCSKCKGIINRKDKSCNHCGLNKK